MLQSYLFPDAAEKYDLEVEALQRLSQPPNPHLIAFYGSYTQGNTHNLILEYADEGTLETYFERTDPPVEEDDIAKFWTHMFGILKALDGIHKPFPMHVADGPVLFNGYVLISTGRVLKVHF